MQIRDLSLCESLVVCARAEEACVGRLQQLLEHVDGADALLVQALKNLIGDEKSHAQDIEAYRKDVAWPRVWHMDGRELERLLQQHFPSLSEGLGTRRLDRKATFYHVESLEKDSARFYRELSESAPDEASRRLFTRMAQGEESHLDELRSSLLPGDAPETGG